MDTSIHSVQVTEITEDVSSLDEDVNLVFSHQIIQDERILNLEETSGEIEQSIEGESEARKYFAVNQNRYLMLPSHKL